MKAPRRQNTSQLIPKLKSQVMEYYDGWMKADKQVEKKTKLYGRAIDSLVYNIKKKNEFKHGVNKAIKSKEEETKSYYDALINKLNENTGDKTFQLTLNYENEIKSLKDEHQKSFNKIKAEKSEIKKVYQEKIGHLNDTQERKLKKQKSLLFKERDEFKKNFNVLHKEYKNKIELKDQTVAALKSKHEKTLASLKAEHDYNVGVLKQEQDKLLVKKEKEMKEVVEEFTTKLRLSKLSKEALERRYQSALLQARTEEHKRVIIGDTVRELHSKKYKRIVTYAYFLTLYILPQILWMLI